MALMPAVDFTLAKRATLRRFGRGLLSAVDICDAHPELLRAARHLGADAPEACPVCEAESLRLVYYSFPIGQRLKRYGPGGRAHRKEDLPPLRSDPPTMTCYEVEACLECSWNHLRRGFDLAKRPRPSLEDRLAERPRRRERRG
jgi:hypothetical protein